MEKETSTNSSMALNSSQQLLRERPHDHIRPGCVNKLSFAILRCTPLERAGFSPEEKGSSPPANSEILQKKHENQIMYVCLIEKFYPEVIRVTWTDDEKEVTDNVVKGDTCQSTKEDEYSIASWLTVPAENEDKRYYCKYEHEEEKASLPTQVNSVKTAPLEEDCKTVFNRDQLMHRTAYLVYIILLLKSSMYYLIVLFIYTMRASTKHEGKKI